MQVTEITIYKVKKKTQVGIIRVKKLKFKSSISTFTCNYLGNNCFHGHEAHLSEQIRNTHCLEYSNFESLVLPNKRIQVCAEMTVLSFFRIIMCVASVHGHNLSFRAQKVVRFISCLQHQTPRDLISN
jgi:hypothetical protein